MVNEMMVIGNLLALPNLEEETVKVVNKTLRDMVGQYTYSRPPDTEVQATDPITAAHKAVADVFGQSVLDEWMNGVTPRGNADS
ncbi:hypothetical protein [Paenibacillus sp. F4]|uniref:hypothetical protein n=1 Tax=Paenibacillus sp. F4 TaxID=357385 RepID=UPI000C9F2EBA|nr:hypothetical protein [Paenibacillus sp. F4]PNQ82687.1 hypothetical protein C1T21_00695 [Paenibacillus sp. F4]